MLNRIARHVRDGGATILRGGVFKPRTSPYSFQGLGMEALKWMRATGDELGMPICVEVMDTRQVESMEPYIDCFQIGARNMQNFDLLREVGKTRKGVLLKRGLAATVKDWLLSAEYVLSQGNRSVILCERGIKTFEDSIRYSMDVTSIPVARQWSHLPVIVDPSHAAGKRDYVSALAAAGMAAGRSWCDRGSSLQSQRSPMRRPAGIAARDVQGTDGPTAKHRRDFSERIRGDSGTRSRLMK